MSPARWVLDTWVTTLAVFYGLVQCTTRTEPLQMFIRTFRRNVLGVRLQVELVAFALIANVQRGNQDHNIRS